MAEKIQLNKNLTVFTSELYQSNSTIVDLEDRILVSDPTWLPSDIEQIKNYVSELAGDRQVSLFISHFDFDHVWGAGAFPDAYTIAPSLDGLDGIEERCLIQWEKWDNEHYIKRPYRIELPYISYPLNTNSGLTIGEHALHFYHCPGHTPDGYCCIIEHERLMLVGDYLCDVEIPWIGSSVLAYRETLIQLIELIHYHKINIAVPGHGSVMKSREEILVRIDNALYYLDLLEKEPDEVEEEIIQLINKYPFPSASIEIHKSNLKQLASAKLY